MLERNPLLHMVMHRDLSGCKESEGAGRGRRYSILIHLNLSGKPMDLQVRQDAYVRR